MRVVVQRVSEANVAVEGETIASIGPGMMVLVGVALGDTTADAELIARKLAELRIFADEQGRFNRSVHDVSGSALVVSQFTLLADTRHGRRPGFTSAAPPDQAAPLVELVVELLRGHGVPTQTGRFGARMAVSLVNDGPVTLILDSRRSGG